MADSTPQCRDGDGPAYAIDREYDEGYCRRHFDEQQAGTEPIKDYVLVVRPPASDFWEHGSVG